MEGVIMTQQRIWKDPTRPYFLDLPERLRYRLLQRLAKMALGYIKEHAQETRGKSNE
jgi:hypothetical protein